jgi:hypothetical protein
MVADMKATNMPDAAPMRASSVTSSRQAPPSVLSASAGEKRAAAIVAIAGAISAKA